MTNTISVKAESVVVEVVGHGLEQTQENSSEQPFGSSRIHRSISQQELPQHFPPFAGKFLRGSLFAMFFLLPLMFGAVHRLSYLSYYLLVATGLCVITLFAKQEFLAAFQRSRVTAGVLIALVVLSCYYAVQTITLWLSPTSHPTLGQVPMLTLSNALRGLASLAAFTATFVLCATYVSGSSHRLERVRGFVIASALFVAAIGLSHWFSDNGRLLWFFEPDSVFVSPRVRWPFVNPNHFAWFLLPGIFLVITRLGTQGAAIQAIKNQIVRTKSNSIVDILSSQRAQNRLSRFVVTAVLLLVLLVPLMGTLSRGGWFGFVVGSLFYLTLQWWGRLAAQKKLAHQDTSDASISSTYYGASDSFAPPTQRHRRRRSHNPVSHLKKTSVRLWPMVSTASIIIFLVMLFFALGEKGNELVLDRLEFGLLNSKNDIRWQLIGDTWPMILNFPLLGVGLGGWATFYPVYMSELVSGINPVYLHSEPMQLLAEGGFVAAAIVGLSLVYISVYFFKAWLSLSSDSTRRLVGLGAAVVGMLAATLFDFQLHIPALQCLFALTLALLAVEIDFVLRGPARD